MVRLSNNNVTAVSGDSLLDPDNLRIGRQIRDLRKSKRVTLADLAKQINKSVG